ncbi:MAG: hypothetical protein ACI9Y7_002843 [Dokdonia sp.]|jgi:hypothetical protein
MQRLQYTLFAVLFLITATTYSQETLVTSSSHVSEKVNVNATSQDVSIETSTTQDIISTPTILQEEGRLSMIRVHSAGKNKPLKSGFYFWNGKQWRVYDTSIISPDKGLA